MITIVVHFNDPNNKKLDFVSRLLQSRALLLLCLLLVLLLDFYYNNALEILYILYCPAHQIYNMNHISKRTNSYNIPDTLSGEHHILLWLTCIGVSYLIPKSLIVFTKQSEAILNSVLYNLHSVIITLVSIIRSTPHFSELMITSGYFIALGVNRYP